MFDDLQQAIRNIEFLSNSESGEVTIACGFHLAASLVSTAVDRMSQQYPRVSFRIIGLESTFLMYDELLSRRVDLVVARKLDADFNKKLDFERLFDDVSFVVASAHHPLARRRRLTLAELRLERWTLPSPDAAPGKLADDAFRALGLDPPYRTVVATQPDVRMHLLATGRFITVFPSSVLTAYAIQPDLKILPVTPALPHVEIGIVTLKGRTIHPATKLVISHIRDVARPLAIGRTPRGSKQKRINK